MRKKPVPFIVIGIPVAQELINTAPLFNTTASPLPVTVNAAAELFVLGMMNIIVLFPNGVITNEEILTELVPDGRVTV
jgi:hypothetical protein